MRLFGGFSVGRWFGFEIRIDYSWFLVFLLVLWSLSAQVFPGELRGYGPAVYYAMGFAGTVLLFLSVLLHELSHSTVARSRGIEVEGITLFIFGGVARTRSDAKSAKDEFLLTVVGPLSSFGLAAAFFGIDVGIDFAGWSEPARVVAENLAYINLVLALFNLVPGFPLDGGRIFRSAVWHVTGDVEKATRWATWTGRAFGYFLVGAGVLMVLVWEGALLTGAWSAFIGWFLASAAATSYRQFRLLRTLREIPVRQVMDRNPEAVSESTRVQEAVERVFLGGGQEACPVLRGRELVGVLTLEAAAAVPPDERSRTSVSEVMMPVGELETAGPGDTLDRVLMEFGGGDESRVMVVEGGELVGALSLRDVAGWVERYRTLGLEGGGEAGPGREGSARR